MKEILKESCNRLKLDHASQFSQKFSHLICPQTLTNILGVRTFS